MKVLLGEVRPQQLTGICPYWRKVSKFKGGSPELSSKPSENSEETPLAPLFKQEQKLANSIESRQKEIDEVSDRITTT